MIIFAVDRLADLQRVSVAIFLLLALIPFILLQIEYEGVDEAFSSGLLFLKT